MRVVYSLRSRDLNAVAAEAAWAEAMGYDGVSTNETAHDPFLPLAVAATSTSRVTLETHVAIAFPRSPMVVAYTARDLQDNSGGRFRLGLGTQVKGHIERRFSPRAGPARPAPACANTSSPSMPSGTAGTPAATWNTPATSTSSP